MHRIKLVTSTKSWESKGLEDLNIWFAVVKARFIVHLEKITVMNRMTSILLPISREWEKTFISYTFYTYMGRWGGLIIVVLISGSRSRDSRPRTLCCVLEQDTLLSISPCLSLPRCVSGYCWISCWRYNVHCKHCDGLASYPGWSGNTPSCIMMQKQEISTCLMGHMA